MAKLSDEELLDYFASNAVRMALNGERSTYDELRAEILDKIKRMGKVDVAGIAREISEKLFDMDNERTPWDENDWLAACENLLRSHLEGKSE